MAFKYFVNPSTFGCCGKVLGPQKSNSGLFQRRKINRIYGAITDVIFFFKKKDLRCAPRSGQSLAKSASPPFA